MDLETQGTFYKTTISNMKLLPLGFSLGLRLELVLLNLLAYLCGSHYHVSINMTQVIIMLRVMSQIFMSKKKVIVGNTDSLNRISYGGTTFLGSMKIIRL